MNVVEPCMMFPREKQNQNHVRIHLLLIAGLRITEIAHESDNLEIPNQSATEIFI